MALGLSGSGLITGFDPTASGFGKVLQVVRATDTTNRSTTSTSFVDVTGMAVTITPQKSTSNIIILASAALSIITTSGNDYYGYTQITDSSNTPISGGQAAIIGADNFSSALFSVFVWHQLSIFAWDVPGSTAAKTYKMRFRTDGSSVSINFDNSTRTGQMFAIEVAA